MVDSNLGRANFVSHALEPGFLVIHVDLLELFVCFRQIDYTLYDSNDHGHQPRQNEEEPANRAQDQQNYPRNIVAQHKFVNPKASQQYGQNAGDRAAIVDLGTIAGDAKGHGIPQPEA